MPLIILPQYPISSILWGSSTIILHSLNDEGHFELTVTDTDCLTQRPLMKQPLPTYLDRVTPILVLDSEQSSNIRLVFLCPDRSPEIMVLPTTWDELFGRAQTVTKIIRETLSQNNEIELSQEVLEQGCDNFYQMLSILDRCHAIMSNSKLTGKPTVPVGGTD